MRTGCSFVPSVTPCYLGATEVDPSGEAALLGLTALESTLIKMGRIDAPNYLYNQHLWEWPQVLILNHLHKP